MPVFVAAQLWNLPKVDTDVVAFLGYLQEDRRRLHVTGVFLLGLQHWKDENEKKITNKNTLYNHHF